MCGVSCVWASKAFRKVLNILCSQQGRGWHSTGVAWVEKDGIKILKDVLTPKEFMQKYRKLRIKANLVIGHNRLPSVGLPTQKNAHPFLSCDAKLALVHNGTEYVSTTKELLRILGHEFEGETDSEVLVHLAEELTNRFGIEEAVKKLARVCPNSTVLILTKNNEVWGFSNNNNLVIVKDRDGIWVASGFDGLVGLFEGKRKYVYLPEGDVVFHIHDGKIELWGDWEVKRSWIRKEEEKEEVVTEELQKRWWEWYR